VGGLPDEFIDRAWADVDGGTKRATLRLYRSMSEGATVREGRHLDRIRCPALVVWSIEDPYVGAEFGPAYADALGGEVEVEVYRTPATGFGSIVPRSSTASPGSFWLTR
jgi:hypothetical protein